MLHGRSLVLPLSPSLSSSSAWTSATGGEEAARGRGSRWRPAAARRHRPVVVASSLTSAQQCVLRDYHDQLVPYVKAWEWQKALVAERVEAKLQGTNALPDVLLMLQHRPVYTLGAGSTEQNLRFDINNPPHELHRTERGGEVTYHGPGQIVVYPIFDLVNHTQDLHWYLRQLEEVAIVALANGVGIHAERIDGLTGVWADGKKLVAIGVRATRWITYHGMAMNVAPDLEPFQHIVPCGIADKSVDSVANMLGLDRVRTIAERYISQDDPYAPADSLSQEVCNEYLVTHMRDHLLQAFQQVFGLHVCPAV
eukprot:jgi/Chlat1/5134/Chrsp33S05135